MKILVVEDDQNLGSLISAALTANRYTVDVAVDGEMGLELASRWNYDLMILDIQLPKLDGINICRRLRSQGCPTPILMLTTRNSNTDITAGLDAGADDYVAKPCDISELLARIRALLRRGTGTVGSPLLQWGELCLNPASAQVTYQQQAIALRPKEYCLLELFLRNPHRILSRTTILDHLWTIDDCPTEHAVTNLIKDLRRQLKAAGMTEDLIETVYGLGYRVKHASIDAKETGPEGQELPLEAGQAEVASPTQADTAQSSIEEGMEKMHRIADRFKASLKQRLDLFVQIQQTLQVNSLRLDERRIAQEEAHRMAGSLGTFGYARGSELARSLELLLMGDAPLEAHQITQFSEQLVALQLELSDLPPDLPTAQQQNSDLQTETVSYLEGAWLTSADKVLVLGTAPWLEELQFNAIQYRLQLECIAESKTALRRLAEAPPAVLLLLYSSELAAEKFATLCEIKAQFPHLPTVVIADQDNVGDRIHLAQLGGVTYLTQPIPPANLVELLLNQVTSDIEQRSRLKAPPRLESESFSAQPFGVSIPLPSTPNTQLPDLNELIEPYLHQEWEQQLKNREPLSLILCEVDSFGDAAPPNSNGDRSESPEVSVQHIAEILQRCLRPQSDRLFSYGVAGFAILLPQTDLHGALHVAHRIQSRWAARKTTSTEFEINPKLVMGITGTVPRPHYSSTLLLTTANQALQTAKRHGHHICTLFSVL